MSLGLSRIGDDRGTRKTEVVSNLAEKFSGSNTHQ